MRAALVAEFGFGIATAARQRLTQVQVIVCLPGRPERQRDPPFAAEDCRPNFGASASDPVSLSFTCWIKDDVRAQTSYDSNSSGGSNGYEMFRSDT